MRRTTRLICQQCNEPFVSAGNRRQRCPTCCVCLVCNKPLRGSWMKTCSHSCSSKRKAALHPENARHLLVRRLFSKTCDTCGKLFESATGNRKRCPECCRCLRCGKSLPDATHRFCGNSCAGKWKYQHSDKVRSAIASGHFAPKPPTNASRGKPKLNRRGPDSPSGNGGARQERHTAMGRIEYKLWRATVFKRDGHACVLCGAAGWLEANHIRRWHDRHDLRYEPNNGVALCRPCHKSIRGVEGQFASRFDAHVARREPVELTAEERERFASVTVHCDSCGDELQRPRYKRRNKKHFCSRTCRYRNKPACA